MPSPPPVNPDRTASSLEWVLQTSGYLQRADLPDHLIPPGEAKVASVLIPLFWSDNQWHVLFIRRVSNQRDHHSGQVAFPGGRRDTADADATETALRETFEEIGLPQDRVQVIKVLEEYRTSSNYVVTPVVGIVPALFDYVAQPTEVDRIFSIPLNWLGDNTNVELRDREVSPIRNDKDKTDNSRSDGDSQRYNLKVVYYSKYDDELLWGASARMTVSMLKVLHTGELILPKSD